MSSTSFENDFLSSIKNKKILLQVASLYGNEEVFDLFYQSTSNFSSNSSNISSPRSPRPSSPRGNRTKGKDIVSIGQSNIRSNNSLVDIIDESIFLSACKGGNINILKRILNDYKSFDTYDILLKGLFSAVGHTNDVHFIMCLYEKLNEKKKFYIETKVKEQTLLFKAAKKGMYKFFDFILRKGAILNSIN